MPDLLDHLFGDAQPASLGYCRCYCFGAVTAQGVSVSTWFVGVVTTPASLFGLHGFEHLLKEHGLELLRRVDQLCVLLR